MDQTGQIGLAWPELDRLVNHQIDRSTDRKKRNTFIPSRLPPRETRVSFRIYSFLGPHMVFYMGFIVGMDYIIISARKHVSSQLRQKLRRRSAWLDGTMKVQAVHSWGGAAGPSCDAMSHENPLENWDHVRLIHRGLMVLVLVEPPRNIPGINCSGRPLDTHENLKTRLFGLHS